MKREQKRFGRVVALFLIAVMLLGLTAPVPVRADTKSDLESKLSQLEKQKKEIESQLSRFKNDLTASQQRKDLLDKQIKNVQDQLNLLDQQINSLNSQVTATQQQITAAQADIDEKEAAIADTKEKLNQRLRAIMKSGNVTTLQMLLNTENYADYLLKAKAVRCIAEKDQATIDKLDAALQDIRAQKTELETKKSQLEEQRASVQALKNTSTSKKKELDTLYSALQTEVRNLQNTVSGYNSQLKRTQEQIAQTDAAIERLIKNASSTGTYNGNMMYWPVPTVRAISSYFGDRWNKIHRGIDIANGPIPIYGENIVAAADGVVIASNYTSYYGSGWCYGYGYCCLVDHGKDSQGRQVTTLYAHCSKMFARVGQTVQGGKTVLAQAGSSGDVTGPHLHFEVRLDGKSVNPYGTYVRPDVN